MALYAKDSVKETDLLRVIEPCMNKVVYGAKYVRYLNLNQIFITFVHVVVVSYAVILAAHMVGAINHGRRSRRLRS